ncbi:Mur ligase family protein, partial [Oceanobacillus caeni]
KNVSLEVIKEALESINGVDGRFEVVDAGQNFTVIVDYAHTPDSLENVLQTVKEFAENDIYVVVGCGGDRDRTKRPLMAKVAMEYSDFAIFTSDNPRTEDPVSILNDMTKGLNGEDEYEVIVDRKEAINKAIQYAKENDIILIAGKGHETYQQIGHTKYDFDDRVIAKSAIIAKG